MLNFTLLRNCTLDWGESAIKIHLRAYRYNSIWQNLTKVGSSHTYL